MNLVNDAATNLMIILTQYQLRWYYFHLGGPNEKKQKRNAVNEKSENDGNEKNENDVSARK